MLRPQQHINKKRWLDKVSSKGFIEITQEHPACNSHVCSVWVIRYTIRGPDFLSKLNAQDYKALHPLLLVVIQVWTWSGSYFIIYFMTSKYIFLIRANYKPNSKLYSQSQENENINIYKFRGTSSSYSWIFHLKTIFGKKGQNREITTACANLTKSPFRGHSLNLLLLFKIPYR